MAATLTLGIQFRADCDAEARGPVRCANGAATKCAKPVRLIDELDCALPQAKLPGLANIGGAGQPRIQEKQSVVGARGCFAKFSFAQLGKGFKRHVRHAADSGDFTASEAPNAHANIYLAVEDRIVALEQLLRNRLKSQPV